MKKVFLCINLLMLISVTCSFSQSTNCADAVTQLQSYASQINQIYSEEYWNVIPGQRCPGCCDVYGRPFNPVMVQNCRLQWLAQLNTWYGQQCNYVNNMYVQIVRGCTTQRESNTRRPSPRVKRGSDENDEIDTDEIEELTADVDDAKTIPIRIPRTAAGFRRN